MREGKGGREDQSNKSKSVKSSEMRLYLYTINNSSTKMLGWRLYAGLYQIGPRPTNWLARRSKLLGHATRHKAASPMPLRLEKKGGKDLNLRARALANTSVPILKLKTCKVLVQKRSFMLGGRLYAERKWRTLRVCTLRKENTSKSSL